MQFIIAAAALPVLAQDARYTTLWDAIPQLTNLTQSSSSRYHPQLGGMNLTHCCLLAINSSFDIQNGNLSIISTSFISLDTTPAAFLSAISNDQFPCTATFNGEVSGAPPVRSTYKWCKSNCNGWQISQAKKLQQWISPMISFILPSLIFCLNIPRSRNLEVNDQLFRPLPGNSWRFLLTPMRFFLAVVIVSVDTLIWLALCFAFASPMIFSGVYEAFWDHRVVRFLNDEGSKLTIEMRARLLYIILVGNIDLQGNKSLPDEEAGPWEDIEELSSTKNVTGEEAVHRTQTRMISMLKTQSSFGSAVGAPIVFFAGGFAYTIADTISHLGDNDTAHALAFGMWWMVIPHVAVISSFLLASNNPSTLEGIVGKPVVEHPSVLKVFALAYPSRYKTEWMWFRGRSKYLWIKKAIAEHNFEKGLPEHHIIATFSVFDWAMTAFFTLVLIAVPVILAFLISYFTPNVGVSCRSLTFAVYFFTQFLQLILWVWALKTSTVCTGGILHSPMRWTKGTKFNAIRCITWWILATIFGIASILTSIGGTIMQLLGVYRNCLCALPIQDWRNREESDTYISLGSNRAVDIVAAKSWWVGIGAVAVTFLCVNCFWGWWYQRRLRGVFQDTVMKCIKAD